MTRQDNREPGITGKDETDEYDLYYGDDEPGEGAGGKHISRGPLSRRPSFNSSIPPFAVSFLFPVCTFLFLNSPYGDYLWASGYAVFSMHEYWRLFTALFTHSGPEHLLSNVPFFIFFGLVLYDYFGVLLFPVIPIVTGIASNAVTLFLYPSDTRIVGASGMVYGMVAMWLVLYIRHDTGHTLPGRIFRATGFALAVMFPEAYYPSTSYLAHAAGFLLGIMCGFAVLPFARVKEPETFEETKD